MKNLFRFILPVALFIALSASARAADAPGTPTEPADTYQTFVFGPAVTSFELDRECGIIISGYVDDRLYGVFMKDCDQARDLGLTHHNVVVEPVEKVQDATVIDRLNEVVRQKLGGELFRVFRATGNVLPG